MENLINTIFPPKCLSCHKYGRFICFRCLSLLKVINEGSCIVCDQRSFDGKTHILCLETGTPTSLFCCFEYEGLVRTVIKKSKYSQKEFAALKELSKEGAKYASKTGHSYEDFIIIPVPLSKSRQKERGFNQSHTIAQAISAGFNLKVEANFLKRVKNTKVQFKMSRVERAENMRDAFTVTADIKGLKVLLVDDICTTGSTFIEASKALYKEGAIEVSCFALSKKVLPNDLPFLPK